MRTLEAARQEAEGVADGDEVPPLWRRYGCSWGSRMVP